MYRDYLLSGVSVRALTMAESAHKRAASPDPLRAERRFVALWLFRVVGRYLRAAIRG